MSGDGPTQRFLDELGAAFRRLQSHGRSSWGFSSAFGRLERVVQAKVKLTEPTPAELPEPGNGAGPRGAGLHGALGAGAHRWLAPWVDHQARVAARQVVDRAAGPAVAAAQEGLGATLEALRFLSARVEALEAADALRHHPVDGLAWLSDPPDLAPWTETIAGWLVGPGDDAPAGDVVMGECGDGTLALALARDGRAVRAAEPRGTVAAVAAQRGVSVHVGPVAELVGLATPGTLGAVVLAGVVDRAPVDEVLQLVALAIDRLAPGAPLVVVSAGVGPTDEVARDLVPGRPLGSATWELVLRRAGCSAIETVQRPPAFAVKGRR